VYCLRDTRDEVIPGSDSLWFFDSGTNTAVIVRAVPDSVFYIFTHLNNKRFDDIFERFSWIKTIGLYYGKVEYRNGKPVVTKKSSDTCRHPQRASGGDTGRQRTRPVDSYPTYEPVSDRFYIVEFKADETFSIKAQHIGFVYPRCISTNYDNSMGEIAVSGDGRRIATVFMCGNIDVFDFDKTSGELTNALYLGQRRAVPVA
jgi:hypothetical protein